MSFGSYGSFGADMDFTLEEAEAASAPDMDFSLEEAKQAALAYDAFRSTTAPPLVMTMAPTQPAMAVKPVAYQQPYRPAAAQATAPVQMTTSGGRLSTTAKVAMGLAGAVGLAVVVAALYKKDAAPMRANGRGYVRKTTDEFDIRGNYGYGHGYETVTTEDTMKEARAQLRTYRENEPGVPFKIVRVRVPIK